MMANDELLTSGFLNVALAAVIAKFLFTPGGWLHVKPGPWWTIAAVGLAVIILCGGLMALLIIPGAMDGGALRKYSLMCLIADPPALLWAAIRLAPVPGCAWLWQLFFWEAAAIALVALVAATMGSIWPRELPWTEGWVQDCVKRRG